MSESTAKPSEPAKPKKPPRRTRGKGSIYPVDGRLKGSLLLTSPDGLTSVRRYVSGRSRTEVERKLDELRKAAEGGFPTGETTAEYLIRWLRDIRPRILPSTFAEYARHVDHYWKPAVGSVELTRLTPAHVDRAMADLDRKGLASTTIAHARSTLRKALHDAMRHDLVNRNVASLAQPPRHDDPPEMHALSGAQVARLVELTADDAYGPLWAVAVGTGLRLGEILGLRWADVDLDARSLRVERSLALDPDKPRRYAFKLPKTKRSRRTVMLSAVAADGLRRQKARQAAAKLAAGTAWQDRDGLVFTDEVGQWPHPTGVSRAWRQTADRLGFRARLHDLRHSYASIALAQGVPLKVVSESLGHSTIVLTADTYTHVTPDLRREAADAIDRALGDAR